jgi:hypothetical protein
LEQYSNAPSLRVAGFEDDDENEAPHERSVFESQRVFAIRGVLLSVWMTISSKRSWPRGRFDLKFHPISSVTFGRR